jgi:hypothetical protein
VRDERSAMSKREAQKRAELLAVMRAHKVKKYKYYDSNGEELECYIDDEPEAKVRKTGEAEPSVGDGLPEHTGESNGVHPGLIEQAMAAQDANVEVTEGGDVVVPDKAAPKSKRSKKS